jgi:cytochrome c5
MSDTPHQKTAASASVAESHPFLTGLAVVVVSLILCVGMIVAAFSGSRTAAASAAAQTQNIAEHLPKVGVVNIDFATQAAHRPLASGEDVYKAVCSACHATGVTGAPKLGDTVDWAPRIALGLPALEEAPLKGFTGKKGTMPPQSGGQFSDYEITRAVVYMANAGGAKFDEPPPPADAASADEAAK